MSIITDFLKLFKYDPETDGASTFNIKQCLNDNWDKIDAWASGIKTTIAGLVPGTRKVNGKELSADVTLTGDDIKTSASDETTISSQLSNKVNGLMGNVQSLGYTKISDITEVGTYFIWNGPSFLSDYPTELSKDGINYGLLRVTNGESCITYDIIAANASGTEFGFAFGFRKSNGVAWNRAVDTTPPQEYDLPLADGATSVGAGYKNTYSKDQFGIVRVWFSIHFDTLPAINSSVFTLPAGFRPDSICYGSAVLSMGEYYCTTIHIEPDGTARVNHGTIAQSGAINMHGFIEFPAGA